MRCTFCNTEVYGLNSVEPPMCDKHLDLAIVCEYLDGRGLPVTVEQVQVAVKACQERSGTMSLQLDDVEPLMSGEFARRYDIVNT